jgi:hypothetical protein
VKASSSSGVRGDGQVLMGLLMQATVLHVHA